MKSERTNIIDSLFGFRAGPLAIVRFCRLCDHAEILKTGRPGVGRGFGMREGNKSRGRMIQHIKAEHADVIEAKLAEVPS